MKIHNKIQPGKTTSSHSTKPFFTQKKKGEIPVQLKKRPFFQPLQKAPGLQKEEEEGKEDKEKKKEEDNKALEEGLKVVGENLMSKNPAFKKFAEPRLEALKDFAWSDRPTSYKASIIGFGLGNLAMIGGVFAADPEFRAQMIDFMQDKNLAAPLGLIPYSEYFPLSSFKYKLPSGENPAYSFGTEFSLTPYWDLLRKRFSVLPEAKIGFGLSGAYEPGKGSFGITGGKFSVGLFGGGLSLTGGTFKELSPFPTMIPGSLPGEPPTTLMKSVPGPEPVKLPGQQFQFMLSLDFMKLFNK